MVLTIEDMQAKMNTGVPSIRSTAQANLDLFRSIRRLTASESAKLVPADSGAANTRTESEMAEDLAYDAARLIRSEGSLAQDVDPRSSTGDPSEYLRMTWDGSLRGIRVLDPPRRSPLSPALSPAYRGEGVKARTLTAIA